MSKPFFIDYPNLKFPKLYNDFRHDFDPDVVCFGLIGHIGSGKSIVACDKLAVQYPIHCGIPDENDEIRVVTAVVRQSKDALIRTIHNESFCSLYTKNNMIRDGLQSRNPSGITIQFNFTKDDRKIRVTNTIHYISLFDGRAEASITGYQPHAILVSEPEGLPAFAFEYLTARSRNVKGVTRPAMIYEGEVPPSSSPFFDLFPCWDEKDRNANPRGWYRDKIREVMVQGDPEKGEEGDRKYIRQVRNRIYVSSDATKYPFNLENLPDDYFVKEQAKSKYHINKRVIVIPTITQEGDPGWSNFIETKHMAPVEYMPEQPIYLFFDADGYGVIGVVQTFKGQIRFLELIKSDGSISQKLEQTGIYLKEKCPGFRIAGAYLDPAIRNTDEFLGRDNSMLSQFKRESRRLFGDAVPFDIARDRLGNPAVKLEVRRDATVKALRDMDDGRVGLLINNQMEAKNQQKCDMDIAKYCYMMKRDGTFHKEPRKTDCADIINYACVTLSSWEDRKFETEEDERREAMYRDQDKMYDENPNSIRSQMRSKIFGKR